MTPPRLSGYSEDELVEQPAIALLKELGWDYYNAYHEFDYQEKSPLKRETKADVVLTARLWAALQKLNPGVPMEALGQVIDEITRDRSRLNPVVANREIYDLLKNGVRTQVLDPRTGEEEIVLVRVIDWDKPKNNDLLFCSQFWVTGEMYTRRADLVGFVNGLPLVFIELKASHKRLEMAYNKNLQDYRDTIPHLFWYNSIIILSNGSRSRIGSISAEWEHFAEWKKIGSEDEMGKISLETILRGVCDPSNLLDIIENFTLFQEVRGGFIKILAKNHQYLGVSNALSALENIKERQGKLGVFWHTQGSGKSVSMIFFSQKILRKHPGNWTFVIVTDRKELDDQIYKNFVSSGVITRPETHAESSAHLRQLLSEDNRYVFTLIHKFRTENAQEHPKLSDRSDIIVITDESHRTQYDSLAANMRKALPNASFIAFTGTPLIVGEEKTRQVFGDYISIYDFKQSVEDGATVPLYYENRIPELQLTNKDLNENMETLLDEGDLTEDQERKLEREFSREYHLITRDDRLEKVAEDIVDHFTSRGFQGKAMVISVDKATAMRMYDKVRKYWNKKIDLLKKSVNNVAQEEKPSFLDRIKEMEKTDMAVVVSQSQNEIRDMREKGLDIRPHRQRIIKEDLDTKFKDPKNALRLVFVCAMWMTGFDVPICSTLYLDKPMRNHTLMQTIARANRVYPGKVGGLIVDYVGVFRSLERALAIYATGRGGERPVEGKDALIAALRHIIEETITLCGENNIDFNLIRASAGFDRIKLLDESVDNLVSTDDLKRKYLDLAAGVRRLYKGIMPDPSAEVFKPDYIIIRVLAEKILSLQRLADISEIKQKIEDLLDKSIAAEGYVIHSVLTGDEKERSIDLSQVDFEELKKRFDKGRKHTELEKLRNAVSRKLHGLLYLNRTRIDFAERFQQMIDEYNAGSINVEDLFKKLTGFIKDLNNEEKRAVKEQLTEEELAIFDILTKPEIKLSSKEIAAVKKTSKTLLEKLKVEALVLDWRKQQQSRGNVRVTIEKVLDKELPDIFKAEIFKEKAEAIYQHVYESYYGSGQSIYTKAA